MKTSINTFFRNAFRQTTVLVAVVGFSITVASARGNNDDPAAQPETKPLKAVVFQVEHSMKFKAHVENPSRKVLVVRIKDATNKLVYQDRVQHMATYIRKFDLSNLADGEYTVEISNGEQVYTQTIAVSTHTARVASLQ